MGLCACSPQYRLTHNTNAEEAADTQGYANHSVNNNSFIARKPEVHYSGHNSPSLANILSQLNPVHILYTYRRPAVMLHFHRRLRLANGLTVQYFLTNTVQLLNPPTRVTCPAHVIVFDLITPNNT